MLEKIYKIMEIVSILIFGIEAILKTISYGFIFGEDTYLKDSWNIADFLMWISSLLQFHFEILKIVSFFRPLKIISKNLNIKIIVDALYQSIVGIINVMVIVFTFWYKKFLLKNKEILRIMFGILGIILFKNRFGYCDNLQNFEVSINEVKIIINKYIVTI